MTPDEIEELFTQEDGRYRFARWGRPVAPVVFGVEDATLRVLKSACEAVLSVAGHGMAETDPELGANLMVFFLRDWAELRDVPDLDRMIPDLAPLVARLQAADASQYRAFRFDAAGAIKAAFVFLRMDSRLSALPAGTLALDQMVRVVLLWSERAFAARSPLEGSVQGAALRGDIAAVIRAAYDAAMPVAATDPAHALRLHARVSARGGGA